MQTPKNRPITQSLIGVISESNLDEDDYKKHLETKYFSKKESLQVALKGERVSDRVDVAFEITSPDWHGDILAERKAKIENGTANFISLDALRAYRQQ